ncbi:hypothetical protein C2G38_2179485 [Gigaspora rosea]|uniref:BED-type domain-containing protein n=1 Tax=Gigaspora rosea TaxID=44941 RepID=A0A397VD37_9GLOM|nr:hypothetical protein C2G38_2179485 [Gigaspora rosea]
MDNDLEYYREMMEDNEYYNDNDINSEITESSMVQASLTHEYFDKVVDDNGKETRVCNIMNENGKKCNQKYKNMESSMGNLIMHLRDEHEITSQDNVDLKKVLYK